MTLLVLSFASYLFALWKMQLMYIGLFLQVAYIISRGIQLERLPLVGPHDTLLFLAASIAAFSIPFGFLIKNRKQFFNVVTVIVSLFTVFVMISKQHDLPLPPVLKTFWFECHVVLAFMSYALFGIAAIIGYIYLDRSHLHPAEEGNIDNPRLSSFGTGDRARPEKQQDDNVRENTTEGLQYRAVIIGYCLFTMSMIFGGIWAYLAWGTYWIWTPKELWTGILWIFYGFYLHARLRQWWTGRPMAYLSIAGFIITMFTYLGVSLLMKSSHSF